MPLHLPPSEDFHALAVQETRFYMLTRRFGENDRAKLEKTYRHAKKAHDAQRRDDGTPYILHPLRATICLIDECGVTDSDTLCAMLLHDVIEDTPLTFDHIARDFGEEVARLVHMVTRPRGAPVDDEITRADKAKKFSQIATADEKTRLIKSADILDNVRSWPNIPCGSLAQQKLPRWYAEVATYALPIAEKANPVLYAELSHAFSFAQKNKHLCVHS